MNCGTGGYRKYYPYIIVALSLVIVLHHALLYYNFHEEGMYISDAWREYDIYKTILAGNPPRIVGGGNIIASCLTTTWLPAMVQKATHISPDLLFKYYTIPLMIWLPLLVYLIAKRYLSPTQALLVSLLYMAQPYYTVAPMVSRVIIAQSFFALGVYAVVKESMGLGKQAILLAVSCVGITLTHYGTTFISIAFLGGWLAVMLLVRLAIRVKYKSTKAIALFLGMLVVASAIWHVEVTHKPSVYARYIVVGAFVDVVDPSAGPTGYSDPAKEAALANPELANPFNVDLTTREAMVQVALGTVWGIMTLPQRTELILTWVLVVLSAAGMVMAFLRKKYLLASAAAVGFLLLLLGMIIPTIGFAYGIQRIYLHFSVFMLICAVMLIGYKNNLLVGLLAACYFLTASGILYYVLGGTRFLKP